MEKIARQGLLYDFYGALLTEHQRNVYEDVVLYDLSLSEIAAERGISRQGVHDLIKRCNKILEDYEDKLHLVEKFEQTRKLAREIRNLTKEFALTENRDLIRRIEEISGEIIELEAH
ncbi:YlxM family DNA-binding protein [Lacrimispora sp.]|uniref:YlxM family DNA-binding protein n=1 Tax=Lacrimispora sp. TaxID=2719234 RepID=UPI002FDB5473